MEAFTFNTVELILLSAAGILFIIQLIYYFGLYLTDVTAHAEMQAITAAAATLGGKYLNECTLYVTVEPCVMCAGAIAWAQTGRLVFGAEDEKRGYQRYAPQALHPKTSVVKGVLADECAALMKDFFAAKRR